MAGNVHGLFPGTVPGNTVNEHASGPVAARALSQRAGSGGVRQAPSDEPARRAAPAAGGRMSPVILGYQLVDRVEWARCAKHGDTTGS